MAQRSDLTPRMVAVLAAAADGHLCLSATDELVYDRRVSHPQTVRVLLQRGLLVRRPGERKVVPASTDHA